MGIKCWLLSQALAVFTILSFCSPLNAGEIKDKAETVRAKIGILINSPATSRMAKSRDRLKAGDMLRIYVHPEMTSYIYVVYSDTNQATLLNSIEQKMGGSTLVLPSLDELYELDGSSKSEFFTIVISTTELKRVERLFTSPPSHDQWAAIEKELIEISKITLTEKSDLPFAIAGNVRAGVNEQPNSGADKTLRIYSGKGFVVKKYVFSIRP